MNLKDLNRSLDVVRIAIGLPTTAERNAKADRLIADAGAQMMAGRNGVLVQLRNGRSAFIKSSALTGSRAKSLTDDDPQGGGKSPQPLKAKPL